MGAGHHQVQVQSSWLQRLPAGLKFLIMLAIVVGASVCPAAHAAWLLLPATIVVGVLALSRLPLAAICRRLLMLEPFVLGVALLALFTPGTMAERWLHFAFLVARCTVSLLALILFTASTPFAEILRLFQRLRVPGLLVTTLALMHRYLFVLSEESSRMRRARQSRTFTARRRLEWRTLSTVIAQLFLRASDRADRIYDAMRARGWNAEE